MLFIMLLERYTKWFNRTQGRSGTLWEDRLKSVIVEDGVSAKSIVAYTDLNPVRAGDGEGSGGVSLEQ